MDGGWGTNEANIADIGIPYTLTALYDGNLYRDNTYISTYSNLTLGNDLQLEYLKITGAYYSEDEGKYATLSDYKNPSGLTPIREGTFYVACFPIQIGDRHPYKAKTFTKTKDKGLVIEPIFTEDSYYGVDGYKFFEWDE